MKKNSLKWGVSAACAVAAEICFAAIDIGAMPHWVYADTEVSTNFPLRLARNPAEDLRFSLEFLSCESNNVEVAFGLDANTNGVLDVSERGLSVGWDCGEWFIRSLGEEPFLCDAATTAMQRRQTRRSGLTSPCTYLDSVRKDLPPRKTTFRLNGKWKGLFPRGCSIPAGTWCALWCAARRARATLSARR